MSVPRSFPALADLSQGIYQATVLATDLQRRRFSRDGVSLAAPLLLDYGTLGGLSGTRAAQGAENCLARSDTFGLVGPVNSGVAGELQPMLNRGGMVTISPSNTNQDLTDPRTLAARQPLASRLGYSTYFRTISTDNFQGRSADLFLHIHLRARTYFLVDDESGYGAFLVGDAVHFASAAHLQQVGLAHLDPTDLKRTKSSAAAIADHVVALGPDAVYCGCDPPTSSALAVALRQRGFNGPYVGGDAMISQEWINVTGRTAAANSYATIVGLDPALSAAWFRRAYATKFHTPLQQYDAYAFDAASIVLNAMHAIAAGHRLGVSLQRNREAVAEAVSTTCYRGATGVTSFDKNGDTRHRVVSVYATRAGAWRFVDFVTIGREPTCR